jgi:hypothetical protein
MESFDFLSRQTPLLIRDGGSSEVVCAGNDECDGELLPEDEDLNDVDLAKENEASVATTPAIPPRKRRATESLPSFGDCPRGQVRPTGTKKSNRAGKVEDTALDDVVDKIKTYMDSFVSSRSPTPYPDDAQHRKNKVDEERLSFELFKELFGESSSAPSVEKEAAAAKMRATWLAKNLHDEASRAVTNVETEVSVIDSHQNERGDTDGEIYCAGAPDHVKASTTSANED